MYVRYVYNVYIYIVHVYLYVCKQVSMYVCTYVCMHGYIYMCMCVYTHSRRTYSGFNIATLYIYMYIYIISYPSQNHPLVLVASTGANGTARIPEVVPAGIPR
jgi:hypothetical protein